MRKDKDEAQIRRTINDLIFEAAIGKAIEDKRELLKPSMQHFIDGGKVNGEFNIALKKLLRWVENKVIEAVAQSPDWELLQTVKWRFKDLDSATTPPQSNDAGQGKRIKELEDGLREGLTISRKAWGANNHDMGFDLDIEEFQEKAQQLLSPTGQANNVKP